MQNPDVALWYNRRAGGDQASLTREVPISENPASTKAGLHWLTIMQTCRRTWEQAAALARPSLHLVFGHRVLVLVLMLGLASHEPYGTWVAHGFLPNPNRRTSDGARSYWLDLLLASVK